MARRRSSIPFCRQKGGNILTPRAVAGVLADTGLDEVKVDRAQNLSEKTSCIPYQRAYTLAAYRCSKHKQICVSAFWFSSAMSTEGQRVDDSPSTSGGSSDGDQREGVQQEQEREQVQPKKKEGKISSKTAAKLSTSAKRIQKELAEITLDPPPNCRACTRAAQLCLVELCSGAAGTKQSGTEQVSSSILSCRLTPADVVAHVCCIGAVKGKID
ncbi:hypothetical protein Anapl_16683 [Anas platyrhynchos]|uniref:Ubiquitin-conjugating enzyme E2 E2 n=1 Tax=Anas platyrhynchos TaxID=8839 RepID=R0L808_ANAPL|nr:hypothetical protein Anapl_16683 [Anas platyrhynchos]